MTFRSILAAAGTIALLSTGAQAQTELSFGHWIPGTHALQANGLEQWAESMSKASDGEITVEFFPAQQLGAAKDHYDMAASGIADFTWVNPGYTPGRFPIMAASELPFMTSNAIGGSTALHEWYAKYADKEMSDVKLCMAHYHHPGAIHSKDKVVEPADIEGKNVRPANATIGRFVSLLGGASIQVAAPEARDALAKGTADMLTFPWEPIYFFGIAEITKYHLDMPLYATSFVIVMNKDRYAGLSEKAQKAVDDHCTPEWSAKIATGWAVADIEAREKMKGEEGRTVTVPSEEQVQAWRDAAAPLTDEWKKTVSAKGVDAEAVLSGLKDALAKHGASF